MKSDYLNRSCRKAALLSGFVIFAAITCSALAGVFTEMPVGHWSYQALDRLARHGVIEDYRGGVIITGKTLTRYEMALYTAELLTDMNRANPESIISRHYRKDLDIIEILLEEFQVPLQELGLDVPAVMDYIELLRLPSAQDRDSRTQDKEIISPEPPVRRPERERVRPSAMVDRDAVDRRFIGRADRSFDFYGQAELGLNITATGETEQFEADNPPHTRGLNRDMRLTLHIDEITPEKNQPWHSDIQLHIEDYSHKNSILFHDVFLGREIYDLKFSNEMMPSFNRFVMRSTVLNGALASLRNNDNLFRIFMGSAPDEQNLALANRSIYVAEMSGPVNRTLDASVNHMQARNLGNINNNSVTSLAASWNAHKRLNLSGEYAFSSTRGDLIDYDDSNAFYLSSDYRNRKLLWLTEIHNMDEFFVTPANRRLRPVEQLDMPRAWYEFNTNFVYRASELLTNTVNYRSRLLSSADTDLERREASTGLYLNTPGNNRVNLYYLYRQEHGVDSLQNSDSNLRLFSLKHVLPSVLPVQGWGMHLKSRHYHEPIQHGTGRTLTQSAFVDFHQPVGTIWDITKSCRRTLIDVEMTALNMGIMKNEMDIRFSRLLNHRNRVTLGGEMIRQKGKNNLNQDDFFTFTRLAGAVEYDYDFDPMSSLRVEYRGYVYNDEIGTPVFDDSYRADSLRILYLRNF